MKVKHFDYAVFQNLTTTLDKQAFQNFCMILFIIHGQLKQYDKNHNMDGTWKMNQFLKQLDVVEVIKDI